MHLLRGYPQEVKVYAMSILEAFGQNKQLLVIVKQELLNILRDSGLWLGEIEKHIREYEGGSAHGSHQHKHTYMRGLH